jgi:hypothetical protein
LPVDAALLVAERTLEELPVLELFVDDATIPRVPVELDAPPPSAPATACAPELELQAAVSAASER